MSDRVQDRIDRLCKPPGSLGDLEQLAATLCRLQQTTTPSTRPRAVTIFAADHGVVAEGVSAWPSTVTAAVAEVMLAQRTASGVFARELGCRYEVVDVGLLRVVRDAKTAVRRGTANLRTGPAMTIDEATAALGVGRRSARAAIDEGCRLLIGGEMGIGNTTPATCLIARFCSLDPAEIVGRGAGVDDAGLGRKRAVVAEAVARVVGLSDPIAIAAEVGGLEIVALAGYFLEAAASECIVLVDGLIATAAAVLAQAIDPDACDWMLATHRSVEPGHLAALDRLGLSPILDLNMRLGEATGALAALPLLDLAAAMMTMATLDELPS